MSRQRRRLAHGGLVNRGHPLSFTFNGRTLQGYEGDTLASALLANGERVVARSFKYHRPRGIFAIGAEEPSALLALGNGARRVPNARATQVWLRDGMVASAQNAWPSLGFDLMRVNDHLSPLLSTGFYNKTFKWPRRFWPLYESVLRKAANAAPLPGAKSTGYSEQRHAHCDVLIVGGGPAGLAAAMTLSGTGTRTWLVDEGADLGGWVQRERATIDGLPGQDWAQDVQAELEAADNVSVLLRTTAFGYYDHNLVALVERLPTGEQRLWRVRARHVILATGAIEQPLVFPNNDLPGVMLAGAARGYLHQYAVRPGDRAVVYSGNDSAYRSAADLADAGVDVAALVDTRPAVGDAALAMLQHRSIRHFAGATLAATGGKRLRKVTVHGASGPIDLACDLLCVSGGWAPALHLHAQSGGRNEYRPDLGAFVPGEAAQSSTPAGALTGLQGLAECLSSGRRAALVALAALGHDVAGEACWSEASLAADDESIANHEAPKAEGKGKQFVDLQNDVTTKDVRQAHLESYVSVEHLKRYTTLGMGTDQGKTSNLNGLALLAELRGEPVPQVGTTTFRPPYTPVTLDVLAGRLWDETLHPVRRTVMHELHEQAGARFDFNGWWLRPQCYLREGETVDAAVQREVLAVRQKAGVTEISTLGKFEIRGRDCVEFLNRVYINDWRSLAVGRTRYGLMLRDDGMVLDDGTVTRLGANHYFITTSTGHADHVLQHLEFLLDVAWPDLDVNLVCVTEQWAGVALAGPESRGILAKVIESGDMALEDLPYMGCMAAEIDAPGGAVPARIMRVSFSGELAHESYVPGHAGAALWRLLEKHGETVGLVPYGMDAMDVLRIEKGFIMVGADADGRTTPYDIGFGRMLARDKTCVGAHALARPAFSEAGRLQLVGLRPLRPRDPVREGAQLIAKPGDRGFGRSIGHVSSAGYSPTLGRAVALAMVRDGRDRHGEVIYSLDPARGAAMPVGVEIVAPCAYDPDGERMRA